MKQSDFFLCKEMLETTRIIKSFSSPDFSRIIPDITRSESLLLSGEGSSRIFPAKHAIALALKRGLSMRVFTCGAREAAEFNLSQSVVFGASNSGRTKEVIELFKVKECLRRLALTAHQDTLLGSLSDEEFILSCGSEKAVAATKSVVEQALFYHALIRRLDGKKFFSEEELDKLSVAAHSVLASTLDPVIVERVARAKTVYFAGRNNGVAEEATLKANEIIRKSADYLEGTYAVHGIEEVMSKEDVVIVIDPFPEEEKKFKEVLVDGVGLSVFAISSRDTLFPTIKIPSLEEFDTYLQLFACWNLLVSVGLKLEINLDKPVRARKVGNEG